MRNQRRLPSIGHAIEGMQLFFRRSPSIGKALKGGRVGDEIPVRTKGLEDSPPSTRPGVPNIIADAHVNYLVLGESGLGKSTFIYNLVSGFKIVKPGRAHVEGPTTMKQFKSDPNSLRTVMEPMEHPDSNTRLHISIQDMPGWGEDLNLRRYLRTVISFLLSRRAKDYEMLDGKGNSSSSSGGSSGDSSDGGSPEITPAESNTSSGGSGGIDSSSVNPSMQLKHSITACLYFVPPHRMKHVDLVIMSTISQLVTVIPVISKADSMTDAELAQYRRDLNRMLQHPDKVIPDHGLNTFSVRTFAIEQSVLKVLGLQQLPVAINCSRYKEACNDEELLSMVGPYGTSRMVQPVRQYQWGAVYPLARTHHSDLLPLKQLLLGDQVGTLLALLSDSHKRYIEFCEDFAEYGGELQALSQDMYSLMKPLEYDDYPIVKTQLDKVQAARRELQETNKVLKEKLKIAEAQCREWKERRWK